MQASSGGQEENSAVGDRNCSWSDFRGATLDTTRKIAIFSYFYINTYFQRVSQNEQLSTT